MKQKYELVRALTANRKSRFAEEVKPFFENAKSKELLGYEKTVAQQSPCIMCALCHYGTDILEEKGLVQLTQWHSHMVNR